MLERILPVDRTDAECRVAEDLDEHTAETEHDDGPETGVDQAADHELHAGRCHLLDEHAAERELAAARHGFDLAHRGGRGRRVREAEADSAHIALVQGIRAYQLRREGPSQSGECERRAGGHRNTARYDEAVRCERALRRGFV